MGGRENSLPRYCFITYGTSLDNRELVLLASEEKENPCQSHSNALPHTLTSVEPAAGPSRGKEKEGRRRMREGGREGGSKERFCKTDLTVRRKTVRIVSLLPEQRRLRRRSSNKILRKHIHVHADFLIEKTPPSVSHSSGILWATPLLFSSILLFLLPLLLKCLTVNTCNSSKKWGNNDFEGYYRYFHCDAFIKMYLIRTNQDRDHGTLSPL